ncbi:glycosyltransferase family 2 protein [Sulfitobacter mediterraneus]|uniref:glycosyltransferase family 2 protein n=1 Tax=Sulfitobacter mediterraneus TaxID=83219 RepID=UPI001933126E|nr:glycosyltransferase family 2 protein [Sulfitobacter mediterraneus]MBM1632352.1 glycosyltransferase family 2 protein [Sulfitobacter mediterraneus]MBM1640169.1 glycosyltransferase family 2 protein [Sulfitobacter mediterraneus]MBM1644217.1 glycosyltransferase family 2 protein [Sulfitobacter mediterraneus]MBM1648264.1 glycosyltransferase family 2 protein [Sulfitobacter mediterraneus]MBM1652309.1 glycosyltransferase family 2 protein [Sulfitobacter mediterraneus]
MTHLAILCVKNEGAFLLEWLAHHRACGFDDFIVFSNDCSDGTDQILDRLQDIGWLTHHRNDGPYDSGGIQFTALKQASKLDAVKRAEWILPLDVDEFVNIHCGDHTLAALHTALPEATAITLTWRLFGNGGIARYADVPVTETFTRCAPKVMPWPWRAAMFKTLYRNDGIYRKPGVHRPRDPDKTRLSEAQWFDGRGEALDDSFRTKGIFSDFRQDNTPLVQLNHYPLGAMESYILKADRGRAVHAEDRLGMDYWVERNFNTDTDTSISALAPRRDALQAELHADPVLGELHQQAVQWRKDRFDALMLDEPNRALFGRLAMTPASEPVLSETASFLMSYGRMAQNRH